MRKLCKFTFIVLFSLCAQAQVTSLSITSSAVSNSLCSGTKVTLAALASHHSSLSVNSYSWIVRPASVVSVLSPNKTSDTLNVVFLSGGSFSISLICGFTPHDTLTALKYLIVAGKPEALFNATFSENNPNKLILTNYSNNSAKNYWVFDGNFSTADTSFNTSKTFAASGTHTVSLITVSSNSLCSDTSNYTFTIDAGSDLTLPNIFTPNDDGVNDVYRPNAKRISKLNASVFNRDGVLIYSWDKVNGFWDGYTTGGLRCVDGQYFIVVYAEGFDGKTYKLKETITLIH